MPNDSINSLRPSDYTTFRFPYHLDNLHLRFNSQMVQENLQILLNLNRIVFHLCDREYSHFAVLPCAVLLQQEWQQHQQAAVVNHPPDVDVAADFRGGVGEEVDSFRYEQGHARSADGADGLQERLPRPLILVLPPSVRPPENHRVGLQPSETSRLNAVDVRKAVERERAERKRFFLVKTGLINVRYLLADFEGTELPRAGGRTVSCEIASERILHVR